MLSASGLSDAEKAQLDHWLQGRCSGRQAMLAILESKRTDEDSKGSGNGMATAALATVVKRAEEFALLSKSINLPEDFLCDSGLLYELVFSRPPSAVIREGLQMLATVALEKCSSALNVEQINLALKQMKIRSLQSQNNISSKSANNNVTENNSEKENEENAKGDDESRHSDNNDDNNKAEGLTDTTDNTFTGNRATINKKQQSLQAAETFRLQILTELIRMHIISLYDTKSKATIGVIYESDTIVLNDSDDEDSGFRKFKEGLKKGEARAAKNGVAGAEAALLVSAQFSDIESSLNIPLQSILGHAEMMPIDDLEASNALLKPYIKQLAGLKAILASQLRDLEDSKAYLALGITKHASDSAIKKAYHSQAVKLHPDKPGGDTKKFQKLQDLYQEVLRKRKDDSAASEFSNGSENDPQIAAETNLADEFVSTMERVLGELQVEVGKCGELGQLNLQWQKNIEHISALPFPKSFKKLSKTVLAVNTNNSTNADLGVFTFDGSGKDDKKGKKKSKMEIYKEDVCVAQAIPSMELICDHAQKLSALAMQLPSCAERFGIAAARHPHFMRLVEQCMHCGLTTMKCLAPLMTADEQLKVCLGRLYDARERALVNEDTANILVEMVTTAFRCCSVTISLSAEKVVQAALVASELVQAARALCSGALDHMREDAKRSMARKEQEEDYCEEDRKYMAERKKKEMDDMLNPNNKSREVKGEDEEEEKKSNSIEQLRVQIKSLQVQLRVQHVQALKSLNLETRDMQRKLQAQLCDLVRQRISTGDDKLLSCEERDCSADAAGSSTSHFKEPPPVKNSLLSLLADFVDGSCNALRVDMQANNASQAHPTDPAAVNEEDVVSGIFHKHLGWMMTLAKCDESTAHRCKKGLEMCDEPDAAKSPPPRSGAKSFDSIDEGEDGEEEKANDGPAASAEDSETKPSEPLPVDNTMVSTLTSGVILALQPDFRTKALWMSALLDEPAVTHMIRVELRERLLDCLRQQGGSLLRAHDSLADSFCAVIIDNIKGAALESK